MCLLTIDFWHYVHYVIAYFQVPGQNAKEHIPGILTLRTNQFSVQGMHGLYRSWSWLKINPGSSLRAYSLHN